MVVHWLVQFGLVESLLRFFFVCLLCFNCSSHVLLCLKLFYRLHGTNVTEEMDKNQRQVVAPNRSLIVLASVVSYFPCFFFSIFFCFPIFSPSIIWFVSSLCYGFGLHLFSHSLVCRKFMNAIENWNRHLHLVILQSNRTYSEIITFCGWIHFCSFFLFSNNNYICVQFAIVFTCNLNGPLMFFAITFNLCFVNPFQCSMVHSWEHSFREVRFTDPNANLN